MAESKDILLVALNAKYIHTAFGMRYLLANLQELGSRAQLIEHSINENGLDIVEQIVKRNPKIVGIGVYIWNAASVLSVLRILKAVRPDIQVVLGGPELSYEWQEREHLRLCDYLIRGEGEVSFYKLCRDILSGHPP
ncbi:MAG: cobalamin B12-binding domain-containing protein, partial [Myxococcota bacterium]|nr:cobalamin B12-binding domain-containing protein [Myxococcota bacterium]